MSMRGPLKPAIFYLIVCVSGGILATRTASIVIEEENMTEIPVKVGVVVDYEFEKWVGKMWLSCINMSLSNLYLKNPHFKTRLHLYYMDSNQTVLSATSAALKLLKDVQVQAILGPTTSMQAIFLAELVEKVCVPIVTFSASAPSLSSIKHPYFFRATENDKTQAEAIAAIVQAFGWRSIVPIYIDNEYGVGIIPYLMESLQEVGTHIPYKTAISPSAIDPEIANELYKLNSMPTRVFILHMSPSLGARLVRIAKDIGMMNAGYVWILTDGMTNFMSSMDPLVIDAMQGAVGVKPHVSKTKELEYFRVQWKRKFNQDYPDMVDAELNIYGFWAYDAAKALAIAVESAASAKRIVFLSPNISDNVTDLGSTFGVSQAGPEIAKALVNTRFRGLTGDFYFVNQKLQPSVFQVVNLHGERPKGVGFWVPGKGLAKRLNSATNASIKPSLGTVIWPGDSPYVPKGWEFRANGKKLKIGVPSDSFEGFVNVAIDPVTHATTVSGFCIDIFDAVMRELSYARDDYEYFPFPSLNGSGPAGSYDDLVLQVYYGNFDVVVGDTTIIASRSVYVDFTLPYTESEVSMLVRIKDEKSSKNAMLFLTPLTPNLWATTLGFFLFVAFVVWVLEHRINDDFRGSPAYQAGTSLWFAFSIMVFAHRERVINNLARAVIIFWSFVVLILTQSYTASFSSLLTVDQLHPAITDVQELIRNREYVGYFNNSFVFGILTGLGFDRSYLKPYESAEQCDQLLSLGSKNGGIAAAIDESPYMKLILARNCSNYTLVQPSTFMSKYPHPNIHQFKTGGFGFVFPKGSPLVADVSRAILKVTEDTGMQRIEDSWISDASQCHENHASVSSSVLGLDSFWGLFLIAGVVSFSALFIYIAMFIYANREFLNNRSSSEASRHGRFLLLLKIFYQKDPKADASSEKEDSRGKLVDARSNREHLMLHREQGGARIEPIEDSNDEQTADQLNIELTNCHGNDEPDWQASEDSIMPPNIQVDRLNNG